MMWIVIVLCLAVIGGFSYRHLVAERTNRALRSRLSEAREKYAMVEKRLRDKEDEANEVTIIARRTTQLTDRTAAVHELAERLVMKLPSLPTDTEISWCLDTADKIIAPLDGYTETLGWFPKVGDLVMSRACTPAYVTEFQGVHFILENIWIAAPTFFRLYREPTQEEKDAYSFCGEHMMAQPDPPASAPESSPANEVQP